MLLRWSLDELGLRNRKWAGLLGRMYWAQLANTYPILIPFFSTGLISDTLKIRVGAVLEPCPCPTRTHHIPDVSVHYRLKPSVPIVEDWLHQFFECHFSKECCNFLQELRLIFN